MDLGLADEHVIPITIKSQHKRHLASLVENYSVIFLSYTREQT